ncbi:1-aminocyclopropane-1-carboxylate deaminase/D-cysteine desulfhydrase [Aquisalibacillus elongatus]|uniref:D-cysteine desulfhydrase n=1 Tax=Aquisalibacillus elongatus TaxID=485577 RepID=A0A3N5B9R5_9BACI|nr:pyridoxal-phosphate dependent enzyme [Aquisalibacillus elongatus]RPF54214.1 D-cysteine desulfhydrase [Aquisalibacillus elongatus]
MVKVKTPSPIDYLNAISSKNNIYIKRDDLTDISLGGNKARKLQLFMKDAIGQQSDCIVTYGGAQSNHCRITAAFARQCGFKVVLVLSEPAEEQKFNGNYFLYDLFDSEIVWTKVNEVPETIKKTLDELKDKGYRPYFIQGGGHGNLGTHAYKLAFDEIVSYEREHNLSFDYIFHASGTGTTQAGLEVGKLLYGHQTQIRGVSVARNKTRGNDVIMNSIADYCDAYNIDKTLISKHINFDDKYVGNGYADIYPEILNTIKKVAQETTILLDPVYTGKAFYGMLDTIKKENLENKNILFLHTGGTPLLFNYAHLFKEM